MRIGLVLPSAQGYSETFFYNKIKGLEANGHSVILFVNGSDGQVEQKSKIKIAPKLSGHLIKVAAISLYWLVKSLVLNFNSSKRLFFLDSSDGVGFSQKIKNLISNGHILSESLDWLHFGYGTMAINRENVAAAIGAKMAVSFRGFDIAVYPVKHTNCYKLLWKKLHKIHVISNDIKDLVYEHGFNRNIPIVKITPAIDTSYFNNVTVKSSDFKYQFVTIARLHWKKGLNYTLEALALLKKKGISFQYTIIGEGIEYERLIFTANQLKIDDCITFKGKLSHELVKRELEKASMYLQYSIQEGFCNAVLEAQAMSLLCIVSDAEGLSENVVQNETGWVVPKRRPEQLVSKIIEVMSLSESKQMQIRQNARTRVQDYFNLELQNKLFDSFYNED